VFEAFGQPPVGAATGCVEAGGGAGDVDGLVEVAFAVLEEAAGLDGEAADEFVA
jgi:hypothetical protein